MRWLGIQEYQDLKESQRSWLVPGLMPEGAWLMLVAEPKEGKSFLALQLAYAFGAGREAFGYTPSRPLQIAYIDIDTPTAEIRDRLATLLDDEPAGSPGLKLIHPQDVERPIDVTSPKGKAWLSQIPECEPDLVVLDVLRELHPGDEDVSAEVKRVTDSIASCIPQHIALLVVHHTRKIPHDAVVVDPVKFARGSGAWSGRMDGIWLLHKNVWHMSTRFEFPAKVKLRRIDGGLWQLVESTRAEKVRLALNLCKKHVDLTHEQMLPILRSEQGWGRMSFYRLLKGHTCAHQERRLAAKQGSA